MKNLEVDFMDFHMLVHIILYVISLVLFTLGFVFLSLGYYFVSIFLLLDV